MKTIAEIRHDNLLALVAEVGSQAEIARRCDLSDVYISQIIKKHPDQKTGRPRQLGDGMARKLEAGCEKPLGWMDNLHTYASSTAVATVLAVMEQMPVWQQLQTMRLVNAIADGTGVQPEVNNESPFDQRSAGQPRVGSGSGAPAERK